MKRLKNMVMTIIACLLMSGCVSAITHFGNENDYPYCATSEVWKHCILVWWDSPGIDGLILQAYIKLTYLIWVVDFPCEVAADTVCLPFDIIHYNRINQNRRDIQTDDDDEKLTRIIKKVLYSKDEMLYN